MRILVLENELTSGRGGQELSLADVCAGLGERGHAVVLAYVTGGDLEARYRRFCERLVRVRAYAVDRRRTAAAILDVGRSLWAVRGTAPDVVYANQYLDSPFAAAAARLGGVPFVCHLRLPPPEVLCGQYRFGMRHVSRLIAISTQTRRDWIAAGFDPSRIDVVPNGIDVARWGRRGDPATLRAQLGLPADRPIVMYAGRLHPHKGVETLLEAFRLLVLERPMHLVVAGRAAVLDGTRDYRAELRALADRLGIASMITWIEHQDDMPALLGAADVTVVPSLWSEPFGRIVIESMACETPVVASRIGGVPEILGGEFDAWLAAPGDAVDLASRVGRLAAWRVSDPALGARARAWVADRFTVDRMVEGVERVLQATVERRTGRAAPRVAASGTR
jgi:glycosyltransferase involved in cell wall biosynthesis